jgi:hypothetical protein
VLAESFLAHNPGAGFSILLVDGAREGFSASEPFELLVPADIGIDTRELARRASMYITQGLAASMKPKLLSELLARHPGAVLYLDADGCIYDELTPVAELAREHSLVLSPHTLDPHPLWPQDSPEQIIMRAGPINAGLLGVGPGAEPFLRWWGERTERRCVFDEPRGLMLAQTWLTLAGTLFPSHVLRDRGCNVAGWNLQARDVQWEGERPRIDGGPLRHFHFAGSYDPLHPEQLTPIAKHARWWASPAERPGVARLSREYAARLLESGYREALASPVRHDAMPSGAPLAPWMRAVYRAALIDAEERGAPEPPNPFADGEARFLEWVRGRAPGEARTLKQSDELLARIGELEAARDEAIEWAEGASAQLRDAERTLAQQRVALDGLSAELERRRATMERVWRSPSWRLTRPLRAAKALFVRR